MAAVGLDALHRAAVIVKEELLAEALRAFQLDQPALRVIVMVPSGC
ncbi:MULTISPECIES: hypothetical protein [Halomonas]|nr:hypothetical protein [Halomonas citrativorans]